MLPWLPAAMNPSLRVLLIEDSEIDAQLLLRQLSLTGYAVESARVENAVQLRESLSQHTWDLVVCDHRLPQMNPMEALTLVQESGLDIPFIMVSGKIGMETAVEMMKRGAHDFIEKHEIARFVPAVERELLEAKRRHELRGMVEEQNRSRQALKASEERYREIYQTTSDIVAGIDVDEMGRFVLAHWNSTTSQLLGLPSCLSESRPPYEILPPSISQEIERLLRACLSTGSNLTADLCVQLRNGTLHLATNFHPVKDEQGRIHRIIMVARDITERKRNEEALRTAHAELEHRVAERTNELRLANERLRELDRLKSEFLATMSHELRTPLNAIIGFTSLVKDGIAGPVNQEQVRQLGMVYSASKHLLGLINDLLDVSCIEAGRISLEREPFDFAQVTAEAIAQLKPQTLAKRIALRPQLPVGALPLIGDRRRCLQVLLNLIHNAIRFTEKGHITVTVRSDASLIHVEVADTGTGIRPELMDTVFEAFRQGDGSARRSHDGTGLGLYLCRKLLTLMGGAISVRSIVAQGTQVSFSVPRQPSQPAAESAASPSPVQ